MLSPDERTALAASDHYARRLRQLAEDTCRLLGTGLRDVREAIAILERARSAELRDPEPR